MPDILFILLLALVIFGPAPGGLRPRESWLNLSVWKHFTQFWWRFYLRFWGNPVHLGGAGFFKLRPGGALIGGADNRVPAEHGGASPPTCCHNHTLRHAS